MAASALRAGRGRLVRLARALRPRLRVGQGAAVHLAVGREGQRLQGDEGGGTMWSGRRAAQRAAQLVDGLRSQPRVRGHHVRHQPLVARGGSPRAAMTTASRTSGWAQERASISPSSMRKPRTLT